MKTFSAILSPIDEYLIHHVITVPPEVIAEFNSSKGAIRVLCSINKNEEFPCALNPRNGSYVIMASKQLIRKHRLREGSPFEVSVRTDPDNGLELPEEFSETLNQDDWGRQLFEELLPGRKRSLLYYIRSTKNTDTRIKRSIEILEKIKTERLSQKKK